MPIGFILSAFGLPPINVTEFKLFQAAMAYCEA